MDSKIVDDGTNYVSTDLLDPNSNSYSWWIIFIVIIFVVIIIIIIIAISSSSSSASVNINGRTRVQISNVTSGNDTLERGGNVAYFATPAPAPGNTPTLTLTIPSSPLNISGTSIQIRNMSTDDRGFIRIEPGAGVTIEPNTPGQIENNVGPFPAQQAILFAIGLNRFVRMQ